VSTTELPGPLRGFASRLGEAIPDSGPDLDAIGRLLVELAADEEYLGPLIADLPAGETGGTWLIRPDRGPRLLLFHRPSGVMGMTHSHQCWVAIAPVRGVETHQHWDARCHEDGQADLRLADERALGRGDVVALTPPGDVHSHGHVAGTGAAPYSLILLGDDQLQFERRQFDLGCGTWQALAPGDPGRLNL
jgi:predicted metal-dependent enzyme (double-stranded beta helix superfamily)